MPFKIIFILIGATLEGKNMLWELITRQLILIRGFLCVQKLVYRYRYQHAKDVCPFIACCLTELLQNFIKQYVE